jgi:shikimate dehydrogenase
VTITAGTRLAAVIGSPVRHSLSPTLHNAAFAAAGLDWRFVAFEVAPGGARDALAAMRSLGIGGFAVTMPHKADVAAAVDHVDDAARALHSVNTVTLRDDGSTFGSSTDGAGFVAALRECGVAPDGRRVVVLGAGGAARSIVDALGRAGVGDLAVVNRTTSRADDAAELASCGRVGSFDDIEGASLLVNTTPVGMGGDPGMPVDPDLLRSDLLVADVVYHPLETPLLAAARSVGARTIDGLGMLVHQAALQQEQWTGVRPDPAVMRAAASNELATRSG